VLPYALSQTACQASRAAKPAILPAMPDGRVVMPDGRAVMPAILPAVPYGLSAGIKAKEKSIHSIRMLFLF